MKITIHNDLKAYVLTSAVKREDLLLVQKYNPKALKVKDKDGNDLFAVGTTGNGVSAHGISFGSANAEGYAIVTGEIGKLEPGQTAGEWVADLVGGALEYINRLETTIPEAVAAITASRSELIGSITVC